MAKVNKTVQVYTTDHPTQSAYQTTCKTLQALEIFTCKHIRNKKYLKHFVAWLFTIASYVFTYAKTINTSITNKIINVQHKAQMNKQVSHKSLSSSKRLKRHKTAINSATSLCDCRHKITTHKSNHLKLTKHKTVHKHAKRKQLD